MHESARYMATSKFASTRGKGQLGQDSYQDVKEGANQTKTRPPDVHAGGLFDPTLREIRKGRQQFCILVEIFLRVLAR